MTQETYDRMNEAWVEFHEKRKEEILIASVSEEQFRSQYETVWNPDEQSEKDLS